MHNYPTLESFLVGFWEPIFAHKDANDLLHLLDTWIRADITTTPDRAFSHSITGGRSDTSKFVEALKSIKAKMMVMPGKTDLYFPSADSSFEVENMPNAVLNIIPSELHVEFQIVLLRNVALIVFAARASPVIEH
jgi:homoserine O-acetyltransferase